jgi:beta-hydroxylase
MAATGVQALAARGLEAILRLDTWVVDRFEPTPEHGLDPSTLPWSGPIEDAWPAVRAELDGLLDDDVRLPITDELVGVEQGAEGQWTTYVLSWFGQELDCNTARCPTTWSLVRDVPGLEIAGFTVMHGGSHIPAHRGPTKALRYQMGVRVPEPAGSCRLRVGDEVIEHADGKGLLFDDRSEHEAWNDSTEDRYVLFVQVQVPLPPGPRQLHRLSHKAFGLATRRIPARAAELDAALNGRS